MTIRVAIADDEAVLREALSELIEAEPGMEFVGEAEDAEAAIQLTLRVKPDVLLVDVRMPKGGGPHAASEVRRLAPQTRILALSAYDDRATVLEMVRLGASGYVVKGGPSEEILEGIRGTAVGEATLSRGVGASVIHELAGRLERQAFDASELLVAETEIRRALDEPEGLRIAYQPIVELASGKQLGAEALARFSAHPFRSPIEWFEEADRVGMRHELEVAAVRTALEGSAQLPESIALAINVSPDTVLLPSTLELLSEARDRPLVVEITEHAEVGNYEVLSTSLQGLKEQGVRLAVDDAGAGFASLRHIMMLDPDIIKIDISIVRGIDASRRKRALASAMISLASELGAEVIAEGIEREEESQVVQDLGARQGQGNLFGRPQFLGKSSMANPA